MTDLKDILIYSSAETFRNSIQASNIQCEDPSAISDEIQQLREYGSKLKFQYLEQETRDKFLRHVLMSSTVDVTQAEIDLLQQLNAAAKARLKQIKLDIDDTVHRCATLAEENIGQLERFSEQRRATEQMMADTQLLEQELDELHNASENENYRMLFNFKKLIDTEDLGLSEAIAIAKNVLTEEALSAAELADMVRRAEKDDISAQNALDQFRQHEARLQEELEEENERSRHEDPEQAFAQRVRRLISFLSRFQQNQTNS